MNLPALFKQGQLFVGNNSTTLLTSVGVTGTVTTAVLTGRASFKAAHILREKETDILLGSRPTRELDLREKVSLVWPHYIPAVGVGSATIAAIIMANRLSAKEAAALAAAYGISERAFQEYKEKVVEKLGEGKETKIRDEIAQDRINAHPVNTREVIIAGTGEVLCFDLLSGRYFQSSVEEIKKAENKVNYAIVNHMYASLSEFYDEVGLPPNQMSDTLGWNINTPLEVKFSTVMSIDDRPCVAIDLTPPIPNYANLY